MGSFNIKLYFSFVFFITTLCGCGNYQGNYDDFESSSNKCLENRICVESVNFGSSVIFGSPDLRFTFNYNYSVGDESSTLGSGNQYGTVCSNQNTGTGDTSIKYPVYISKDNFINCEPYAFHPIDFSSTKVLSIIPDNLTVNTTYKVKIVKYSESNKLNLTKKSDSTDGLNADYIREFTTISN